MGGDFPGRYYWPRKWIWNRALNSVKNTIEHKSHVIEENKSERRPLKAFKLRIQGVTEVNNL